MAVTESNNVGHALNAIDRMALMRTAEVAEVLGVAPRTVRRISASGHLPCIRLGYRTVRYREADVLGFIGEQVTPTTHDDPAGNGAAEKGRDAGAQDTF